MLIAYCTLFQGQYGQVTKFAKRYGVSRQTIYAIKATGKAAFMPSWAEPCEQSSSSAVIAALKARILSLRMEGRCGLYSIQKILRREGAVYDSIGFISETLTEYGRIAGNDLELPAGCETLSVAFAADEIYAGSAPILVVVDPRSLVILRITLCKDRSAATWEHELSALTQQGIYPSLVVKDDGTGMNAAFNTLMPDVRQQTDTFHAVAHRFGEYKARYLRAAYIAIQAEYDAETQYNKAKSDETRIKYYERYFMAKAKADAAIALYDDFCFLYNALLAAFNLFNTQGDLKNMTRVMADFDAALDLLPLLKHTNLAQITAHIQSIRTAKPKLFTFLHTAQNVVQALAQTIDPWLLKPLCQAWQARKNALKAKNPTHKKQQYAIERAALHEAECLQPGAFQARKNLVYDQLSTIIQSSSAVECINSLLRPYLNNARNQISQETLNLFMFYHNNHAFDQGERKGKSPMQILTGLPQQDWIAKLMQTLPQN